MADLSVTPADVAPVKIVQQFTAPAAEDIDAGQPVRLDTTSAHWTLANGTTAPEARVKGLAMRSVLAGGELTALQKGIMSLGAALDALAPDAPVYLSDTDGTLATADTDATVDVIVGRVVPGFSGLATTGLPTTGGDRLLEIDL